MIHCVNVRISYFIQEKTGNKDRSVNRFDL